MSATRSARDPEPDLCARRQAARDEDIALELGCARTTVQRAMQDLSMAGLVERKRKGGTHVRTDPVTRATFDIPITRREVEQRAQSTITS
jgi:GntR family histidine utilization transcriptional repressor